MSRDLLYVFLLAAGAGYLLFTSWQLQRRAVAPLLGFGRIVLGTGALLWGLMGIHPYDPHVASTVRLLAAVAVLAGGVMASYATLRTSRTPN